MEENIKRISYSQFTVYLQCPHRWKLQYKDGIKKKEASINLTFGTAIHLTIQEWLPLHFNNEKKAKVFDFDGALKEHLLETFKKDTLILEDGSKQFPSDKQTLMEFYYQGCAILSHIRKQAKTLFPTKDHALVGCEIPLEVMLTPNVLFNGFIDIVIMDTKSKEVHIYDLKTSGRGWYSERKDPMKLFQVLLYKKYYAEMFDIDEDLVFVSFLILKRKVDEQSEWANARNHISKFVPSQGKISTRKAVAALRDFHEAVFDSEGHREGIALAPTPSAKACKYCPFNNDVKLCSASLAWP